MAVTSGDGWGNLVKFVDIAPGGGDSLAVDEDRNLWIWGSNYYNQLGDGTKTDSPTPRILDLGGKKPEKIYSNDSGLFVTDTNGDTWAWGSANNYGQLGVGTKTPVSSPTLVKGGHKFTQIGSFSDGSIGLDTDHKLWTWGSCGAPCAASYREYSTHLEPVPLLPDKKFVRIATGYLFVLAIDTDGDTWGWGWNTYGQLGDGTTTKSFTPVKVLGGHKFAQIYASMRTSLGIDADGKAWTWGSNGFGALGQNKTDTGDKALQPAEVAGRHIFQQADVNEDTMVAIDANNKAWGWGENTYGQLGNGKHGNSVCSQAPESPNTKQRFKKIMAGRGFTLAIGTDGNLYSWGETTREAAGYPNGTYNHYYPERIIVQKPDPQP